MTSHLHLRIIDTPLVDNKAWRTALVERMAKDLIRNHQAAGREADAIRTLHKICGHAMADIVMCIDDVRHLAFSEIVAKEMVKP
jgi:hypothetical protein